MACILGIAEQGDHRSMAVEVFNPFAREINRAAEPLADDGVSRHPTTIEKGDGDGDGILWGAARSRLGSTRISGVVGKK